MKQGLCSILKTVDLNCLNFTCLQNRIHLILKQDVHFSHRFDSLVDFAYQSVSSYIFRHLTHRAFYEPRNESRHGLTVKSRDCGHSRSSAGRNQRKVMDGYDSHQSGSKPGPGTSTTPYGRGVDGWPGPSSGWRRLAGTPGPGGGPGGAPAARSEDLGSFPAVNQGVTSALNSSADARSPGFAICESGRLPGSELAAERPPPPGLPTRITVTPPAHRPGRRRRPPGVITPWPHGHGHRDDDATAVLAVKSQDGHGHGTRLGKVHPT